MKHVRGSAIVGAFALLVGFATGCAAPSEGRAPAQTAAQRAAFVESWTDDGLARVNAARAALRAQMEADATDDIGALPVESVHRARLEIARAALIDANDAKQQLDAAEQLERELETLMDRQRTAKARPHREDTAK